MTGRARIGILICILIYLSISLEYLDTYPPVGQDEPWIAAAPYKLATEGILGSDLFAGYYGVERHNYQHMPLFPLLQAAVFRIAGVGVYQMRLLPVAFGALLLATTYLVGNQVGGPRTGVLAAVLLLGLRLYAGHDETGILLLDRARVNRYDIAVPVFGLLALWLFNRAEEAPSSKAFLLVGILIGLASLSHLYGIFWLPTLWAIGWLHYGALYWRRNAPYLILAGSCVTWLPWLLFIASGWDDFVGQMRFVGDRFEVFDAYFYVGNLVNEIDRYRALDLRNPDGLPYLNRPGTWLAILGIPVALTILARRGAKSEFSRGCNLAMVLVMQSLLFATLLKVKSSHYVIAVWPLAVLCLAWFGLWVWNHRPNRWVRGLLLLLLCLVLVEGAGRIGHRRGVAAKTTPYDQLTAQVAGLIPSGARVLGLQHFWLGLRAHPYRTWLLPLLYALPEYCTPALALDEALALVNPDIILLDYHMQVYFDELADAKHPNHTLYRGYQRFMDMRNATLLDVIEDDTYGALAVYQVDKPTMPIEPLTEECTP